MNENLILEDERVSFDTAKLAKEKGFDIPTTYYFDFIGDTCSGTTKTNWNKSKEELYSKPTQALLQRWLREVHNIILESVFHSNAKYYWATSKKENNEQYDINSSMTYYDTYEEALELGFIEALKYIK